MNNVAIPVRAAWLAIALIPLSSWAQNAPPAPAAPTPQPAAAAPAAPATPAEEPAKLTIPERQAKERGFTTCAPLLSALTAKAYASGGSHHALSSFEPQTPDARSMNSMVITEGAGKQEITSFYVSNTAASKCDGGYFSVLLSEASCLAEREEYGMQYKYFGDMGSNAVYVKNKSEYLTLMPLPKGCLVLRSETLY